MSQSNLHHSILGKLQHDENLDCYVGQFVLDDAAIELVLKTDEESRIEPAIEKAINIFLQLSQYANDAKQYAVDKLLDLKNQTWLEKNEMLVTSEEFKSRLSLESLVFSPDKTVSFYFDDGDLFFGHQLEVLMDENNQFKEASI